MAIGIVRNQIRPNLIRRTLPLRPSVQQPIPAFEIFPGIIPRIAVVYVYPVFGGEHDILAQRFIGSYILNYPRVDHELVIVCNGGEATPAMVRTLSRLKYKPLIHDDSGWDIGAYQLAANLIKCDLMVFLGGSSICTKKGWMERIIASHNKHGETLYGCMHNTGDANSRVWPHIRTTGFWMNPELMNRYPKRVSKDEDRYPFEHGENCLTSWIIKQGLKPMVVTWDNEYELKDWAGIPNSFHRGNQSGLLFKDRLALPPYYLQ